MIESNNDYTVICNSEQDFIDVVEFISGEEVRIKLDVVDTYLLNNIIDQLKAIVFNAFTARVIVTLSGQYTCIFLTIKNHFTGNTSIKVKL